MSSWEVPGGFTNTGLDALPDGTLAIGDFDGERIVICDIRGKLLRTITLESAPNASVQGVAWDTSRNQWWVCHYGGNPMGSLRRYNDAGALQQTISLSGIATLGPNGSCYDAANDRVLLTGNDNVVRGINLTTGAVAETITLQSGVVGAGVVDGVVLDPTNPTTRIWVSVDAPQRKIVKVDRSNGAAVSLHDCPIWPESMAWIGGRLYIACDGLYHDSIPNGNRVHWLVPEAPGTHTLPVGDYAVA